MISKISFSYLIPVRNGMPFLPNFRKIIDQLSERTNDEVLIVNDASTDGTDDFLYRWSKENPALNVLTNKAPGLVNALNLGIRESSHNWIARFDVDDVYSPRRLELQGNAVQQNTAAIFSDYTISTKSGIKLSSIRTAISNEATRISLIQSRRTPHPAVIFNKAAIQSVGGYHIDDFPCEDLSLWLRLSKTGQIATVPFELLKYRLNPTSISSTQRFNMKLKKVAILNQYPITQLEVMTFISMFQEYAQLIESSHSALNRIASSLSEIQECSKIYGYSLPKRSEIFAQESLRTTLSLGIEDNRNLYERIIRNSYKKLSSPL
jgi:hypothetical protein